MRTVQNNMIRDAEGVATKYAKYAKNGVYALLLILGIVSLFFSVYFWIVGGVVLTNASAIILSILGLLQVIDYVTKLFGGFLRKIPGKAYKYTFSKVLGRKIRRAERISKISLSV